MMAALARTLLPVLVLLPAGCFRKPPPALPNPTPITADGLHNAFRLTDRVFSGSGPEGEAAFAALRGLGVKTILSVDGATPDATTARKYGIRYVHILVGYDGIPDKAAWRIARAVRDLPGPVYVHCHHGKHRGPAAAAAALLCLDPSWTPDDAEEWLRTAGTDPRYRGLFELPHTLHRPTAGALDRASADFPEAAAVPSFVQGMVAVDARWDRLKSAKAAGWTAPPDHPDADPPHEALQLAEQFREISRTTEARNRGSEFLGMLSDAEFRAEELEKALRTNDRPAADAAFKASEAACVKCHATYRDNGK